MMPHPTTLGAYYADRQFHVVDTPGQINYHSYSRRLSRSGSPFAFRRQDHSSAQ